MERDGDEQRLYCYSEAKAKKEEGMNSLHRERSWPINLLSSSGTDWAIMA